MRVFHLSTGERGSVCGSHVPPRGAHITAQSAAVLGCWKAQGPARCLYFFLRAAEHGPERVQDRGLDPGGPDMG